MKKAVLRDLIIAHYKNEPSKFFQAALEVLKEFQDDGDVELAKYIADEMRPHLKVVARREPDNYRGTLDEVEVCDLGFVPMGSIGDEQ